MHRSRVALCLLLVAGCSDRPTADPPTEESIPPELVQAHEEACERWCDLRERCDGPHDCVCETDDLDSPLCAMKTTASLECRANLACEQLPELHNDYAPDQPCFGEGVAASLACYY